jgi:histidinol-phosphate aminotransferase
MLFAAAAIAVDRNEQAVLPGPTFAPVGKNIRLAGGEVVTVPVLENGSNNVDAMLDAVNEHTALFYLCTPNSPTGGMLEAEQIKLAVDRLPSDCLLMVDEAYHEFAAWEGGPDVLSLLSARGGPWAVIRTFSKAYGLSGARIGYAITGNRNLAVGFSKVRIGFNVNRIALAGACAAMRDQNYLEMVLGTVSRERQRLSIALQNYGLRVYPSAANFLLARTNSPSDAIATKLAERHILVQALPWPDDNGSLRITIGTAAENNIFLNALTEIL